MKNILISILIDLISSIVINTGNVNIIIAYIIAQEIISIGKQKLKKTHSISWFLAAQR